MRYRKEGPGGDYVFGNSTLFLVDTPEAVAQAVMTRLRLYAGEWFLDLREGLDLNMVLGYGTQVTRDREVQQRIIETTGVLRIVSYSSNVESNRTFRVTCTIDTIYGPTTISEVIR
jgi:hypothetical protein